MTNHTDHPHPSTPAARAACRRAAQLMTAPLYEVFRRNSDAFITVHIAGMGYYDATHATLTLALLMGREGMLARCEDVYDGESDAADQLATFASLPTEILAIAVADFTFTR